MGEGENGNPLPDGQPLQEGKSLSNGEPLLVVEAIRVGYGKMDVLHGVSLAIHPGEVVAIIGPNGAGKSTVIKTVVGLLKPSAGHVLFGGEEITAVKPHLIVRRKLAYVPQGRIVFPRMTVVENLEMGGYTLGNSSEVKEAIERVMLLFPRLAERRKQLAGTMSGGEQQMLAIARALMVSPRLILMDEPSLGLAPKFVDVIFETIVNLARQGITLGIVEQNAARALEIAHRGYVLELGNNKYQGYGRELLDDPRIRRMYLGGH
jgi:branched-chain amino acid transport system ATP-binding protein